MAVIGVANKDVFQPWGEVYDITRLSRAWQSNGEDFTCITTRDFVAATVVMMVYLYNWIQQVIIVLVLTLYSSFRLKRKESKDRMIVMKKSQCYLTVLSPHIFFERLRAVWCHMFFPNGCNTVYFHWLRQLLPHFRRDISIQIRCILRWSYQMA